MRSINRFLPWGIKPFGGDVLLCESAGDGEFALDLLLREAVLLAQKRAGRVVKTREPSQTLFVLNRSLSVLSAFEIRLGQRVGIVCLDKVHTVIAAITATPKTVATISTPVIDPRFFVFPSSEGKEYREKA